VACPSVRRVVLPQKGAEAEVTLAKPRGERCKSRGAERLCDATSVFLSGRGRRCQLQCYLQRDRSRQGELIECSGMPFREVAAWLGSIIRSNRQRMKSATQTGA
jgi:hypothetical protein